MLKQINSKSCFLVGFLVICFLQVLVAYSSDLFVDEAFYWLEGQNLDWSYSEVPGFVPWTLALSHWLLPHDPFWLRLPTLTMAALIPWLGIYLAQLTGLNKENAWTTGLLLISLPLLGITGTLAIADIWIVGFTLMAFIFSALAFNNKKSIHFVGLGLVLALGVNIHIRFWLIILIACLLIFWRYKNQKEIILSLLKITLPIMLLGFVPIFIFNVQNDFPLLAFQLKDRHPWEFQPNHFSFFLIQVVITTPLIFILCLQTIYRTNSRRQSDKKLINILLLTAVIHWLIYALLGFFSDTLRLNLHWTLVSYVLLLIVASLNQSNNTFKTWAIFTGYITNIGLLFTLIYWQNIQSPRSNLNARITQNTIGYSQLSSHTEHVLKENKMTDLLTDSFMTLSQLAYYSESVMNLKSIHHPLNSKHGREKQLKIMNLIQGQTTASKLLLVEHSALKLEQYIDFYLNACQQLNGIELIDSLDLFNGLKTYHYFQTGQGNCELPPIIYHEKNDNLISGWIIEEINKPFHLKLNTNSSIRKIDTTTNAISSNKLFKSLDPNKHQLKLFSFNHNDANDSQPLQLLVKNGNQQILSHRLN